MRKTILLGTLLALVLASCSSPSETTVDVGAEDPLIQITSEGGFVPVEFLLAQGPRFTVLGDGQVLFQGPQPAIHPGPLVNGYLVAQLNDQQLRALLSLVDRIGLPDIVDEFDNGAAQFVADASTEVVTYWDGQGSHRLAVYALGIQEESGRNAAFQDLVVTLDEFSFTADAQPWDADRVRVLAGEGFADPQFRDVREWPLDDDAIETWDEVFNGWACKVFDSSVLSRLTDASQATQFTHPGSGQDLSFLVRQLHPGEPDCP